jgi:O-antigen/teichoic acid export membrane protein
MTEHERCAAALLILSAMINVVAGAVFINMLGLAGAAVALTIALIVWNVAMALFISRRLRLVPGVLGMFGSNRR